jgi:diguanylate cyclase (GGDEF)-like protein/PAS domain S-box-containing protein
MAAKQARILIVEDESIVQLDIMNSLQVLGYEVVGTASSGEEGIKQAEVNRPDLVLMDIILKGNIDGVRAAEKIRSCLKIPVIYLTACADNKTLQRAKITEPFGYVLKPFEERELHGHIQIALYKHGMEKRLKESEERYSLATQGANDGLWDWDIVTRQVYFSPRWKSMLGYRENQIGARPEDWLERIHPEDKVKVKKKLAEHFSGLSPHFESEYRIQDAAGAYRWMLCRGLALRDGKGRPNRMAGSQTDITDRKVFNPLTGLPNRTLLMDRLERALERSGRHKDYSFAVLALNIDGLKIVNDSLGCLLADELLVQIARRLEECLHSQDTVAHLGDDAFVMLIDEVRSVTDATAMATQVSRQLELPFSLDGNTVYISCMMGITFSTKGYQRAADILRDAHTAMHRAKKNDKGRCEIFDKDMRSSAVARLQLESDLRNALQEQEFRVYYQPIVCLKTGMMCGFEALVRWHRRGRLVQPKDFLPLAESTKLIVPMERWILREACHQAACWNSELSSDQPVTLNVNLSPSHLAHPDLVLELREILTVTGLDATNLRLEITESSLIENTSTITETLSQIKNLNIQVHMDDFGTGYSSLNYLHRFPIHTLKMDGGPETRKIVQTIITLAQNLSMEVIAEGIESANQLKILQILGCDYGQGYYFSKPMDHRSAQLLISGEKSWMGDFELESSKVVPLFAKAK